jgi:hypothetical protein
VIAAAKIGGKYHLLDASSKAYPFGLIPAYCLNGKGRLMAKTSSWIDLKAGEKMRTSFSAVIDLTENGFEGTVNRVLQGYDAVSERSEQVEAGSPAAYASGLQKKWNLEVNSYESHHLDSIGLLFTDKMKIRKDGAPEPILYFNPFIVSSWPTNPFHSTDRVFPVDFGSAFEQVYMLSVTLPENYEVDEMPVPTALALPNSGGKLFFNVTKLGGKINIAFNLSITRPVFGATEYGSLKEFFARVVQIQQSQIILKRKT